MPAVLAFDYTLEILYNQTADVHSSLKDGICSSGWLRRKVGADILLKVFRSEFCKTNYISSGKQEGIHILQGGRQPNK
ncbi:MAG: hypothetical protein IPI63_06470 [Methanothrix sp.]|jgi:hypothetical protein|uniref:hypothetical protein n=1 Tax=Methanothrix sp. TaxID=90426 RepID=UPI0025CDF4A2|nr:hypothetical protein [Methanothrix sp.]MBK7386379.1 hypothetical protein [Methanothrix sp.]HPW74016.1 hypothetical protein [Methanothrix sp.]